LGFIKFIDECLKIQLRKFLRNYKSAYSKKYRKKFNFIKIDMIFSLDNPYEKKVF